MANVPNITLNDGNIISQLGLGVYQVSAEDTVETVTKALEIGYRHIDTAEMYQNEQQVGDAIVQSSIDRTEIFITSKLNNGFHEPSEAEEAFIQTLHKLQTDYIDLFLIHWPLPTLYNGDYPATWKTLESFKADGRAKSIGVSNFQVEHLQKLLDESEIVPAVNQIEVHPYFLNQTVKEFGEQHHIVTEAWSPIAQGGVLKDVTIMAIAKELQKTSAQIVLRWHIQRNNVIFPKSTTPARIEDNFNIFDFSLSDEQLAAIDQLDKGAAGRTGPNPDTFDYLP